MNRTPRRTVAGPVNPRRSVLSRIGRWDLWSLPRSAVAAILIVEAAAIGITATLVAAEPFTITTLIRFAALVALSIGYSAAAAHSGRMQQYLGADGAYSSPLTVWSCAALLVLPTGWAGAFVCAQYGYEMWQRRRHDTSRPHRTLFTAASSVLAQIGVGLTLATAGSVLIDGHGVVSDVLTAVAGPLFVVLSAVVLLGGMWLAMRRPPARTMLPDREPFILELALMVLGLATAELLVHASLLTPVMVLPVLLLQRSSIVSALQRTARTDAKTGLLTSHAWTDNARRALNRAERGGEGLAVLLIDLDHFKSINDTRGHLVGDQALQAVATCLKNELRNHDAVGRFGGEEFVVVVENVGEIRAAEVADRLRQAIAALEIDDALRLTASIGVAHTGDLPEFHTVDSLLERADQALYKAKAGGRNRVRVAEVSA